MNLLLSCNLRHKGIRDIHRLLAREFTIRSLAHCFAILPELHLNTTNDTLTSFFSCDTQYSCGKQINVFKTWFCLDYNVCIVIVIKTKYNLCSMFCYMS